MTTRPSYSLSADTGSSPVQSAHHQVNSDGGQIDRRRLRYNDTGVMVSVIKRCAL